MSWIFLEAILLLVAEVEELLHELGSSILCLAEQKLLLDVPVPALALSSQQLLYPLVHCLI